MTACNAQMICWSELRSLRWLYSNSAKDSQRTKPAGCLAGNYFGQAHPSVQIIAPHTVENRQLGTVFEEADESAYWIELLTDAEKVGASGAAPLHREATELVAITVASINTARRNASE